MELATDTKKVWMENQKEVILYEWRIFIYLPILPTKNFLKMQCKAILYIEVDNSVFLTFQSAKISGKN